ncbi:MAG: hydrogenase expression/formation protein HypE [Thermoguttaceae bacterium]
MSCPLPLDDHATVQLAHGGGGRMMRSLVDAVFLKAFEASGDGTAAPARQPPHDSAVVQIEGARLAFTTDTFVVHPLFFPGGDIGRLAVYGTVNDLAMAGARPLFLSAGFVLEEGLPLETLGRVVASMRDAARLSGVRIVTGDTKVVDRGKGDGVFINTAGIGLVPPGVEISPCRVVPGDVILVSGDLGRHGMAVMSVREGLGFEGALESDCEPLAGLVEALLFEGGKAEGGATAPSAKPQAAPSSFAGDIHCLRDLTRGGLAAALCEIAEDARVGIELDEAAIPVSEPVAGACELLGLDPLYVANEGRLVAMVAPAAAAWVLEVLRGHPAAHGPAEIGRVVAGHPGTVEVRGLLGGGRILDLLSGEQMPRIC